jgi:hypothetical protein
MLKFWPILELGDYVFLQTSVNVIIKWANETGFAMFPRNQKRYWFTEGDMIDYRRYGWENACWRWLDTTKYWA